MDASVNHNSSNITNELNQFQSSPFLSRQTLWIASSLRHFSLISFIRLCSDIDGATATMFPFNFPDKKLDCLISPLQCINVIVCTGPIVSTEKFLCSIRAWFVCCHKKRAQNNTSAYTLCDWIAFWWQK